MDRTDKLIVFTATAVSAVCIVGISYTSTNTWLDYNGPAGFVFCFLLGLCFVSMLQPTVKGKGKGKGKGK